MAIGEHVVVQEVYRNWKRKVWCQFITDRNKMGLMWYWGWIVWKNITLKFHVTVKWYQVKTPNNKKCSSVEKRTVECKVWFTAIKACRGVKKGYESFIVYVIDSRKEKKKLEDIKVVRYFTKIFPMDLTGLLPERQVDFWIDVVPGATLIYHYVSFCSYKNARDYVSTSRITR